LYFSEKEPDLIGQSFGSIWSRDELQEEETMYNKDKPIPPKFKTHFKAQLNLKETEPARFDAKLIPIGDPTMKVEWFRNGEPIRHANRYVIKYDYGYVLMDMLWTYPEDDGIYECVATNAVGQDRTRAELKCKNKRSIIYDTQLPEGMEGMVKLQELEEKIKLASMMRDDGVEEETPDPCAPEFIMHLADYVANEGELARFMVKLTGFPRPRLNWYINKEHILNVILLKNNLSI
jgi:titin